MTDRMIIVFDYRRKEELGYSLRSQSGSCEVSFTCVRRAGFGIAMLE
jgi:hypothetical protein